ncbi:MAG: methyltransferase [Bacteroidales bacterium]
MSNTYFKFKQFTVNQDKTSMKVGVDGVLLGAWADATGVKSILDIGTGTGLLSLMLAQKSDASITAIEIDEDAFKQACMNFENSRWKDRIDLHHISFQNFMDNSNRKFDLIICNPPYFVKSLKSADSKRNIARHDDLLPLETLLFGVSRLLSVKGRFYIIYPYLQLDDLVAVAEKNTLYPAKKLIVKGKSTKLPNRVIVEFFFNKKDCLAQEIVVRNFSNNEYTDEYKKLTSGYYLAF